MDRLQEANKVASLMRRRENAKAIPASQLARDSNPQPRLAPSLHAPVRQPSMGAMVSTPLLHATRITAVSRDLKKMRPTQTPARTAPRAMDSVNRIAAHKTALLLPAREAHFPVQILQAGAVSMRMADSPVAERRKVASLDLNLQRTHLGGNGIQLRALPPSATRLCKEPQLARRLNGSADRGRELRVSGGIGFRLPKLRLRTAPFGAPQTTPLLSSTQSRNTMVPSAPASASAMRASLPLTIRGVFGPAPPAKNGRVELRWPTAILHGANPAPPVPGTSQTCAVVWVAATPRSPQLRLKNGTVQFNASVTPRSIPAPSAVHTMRSSHRLTLVRFEPQEPPFECAPTALFGSLLSGMHVGATPVRKENPAEPVIIEDHFEAGLQHWLGGTDDWKLDVAGVRPGSLALFTPTLELTNYQLEFLTRIESRGVNWVVRAANFTDYYQLTFASVPAGGYEFRRSAVVDGVAETPMAVPAPGTPSAATSRTAVTLRTRVEGDEFTVYLDGQVIETWKDRRFATGGIGFVGAPEDRARLYWVKITPAGHRNKEHSKP